MYINDLFWYVKLLMNLYFIDIIFFVRYLNANEISFSGELKKVPGHCDVPSRIPERFCSVNLVWIYFENSAVKVSNLASYELSTTSTDQCKINCLENKNCFSVDFRIHRCQLNEYSIFFNQQAAGRRLATLACCNGKSFYVGLLTY